jgi:hypothetical protein
MMRRTSGLALLVSIAAVGGLGLSTADAAPSAPPRPGAWAGQEANGTTPSPVSFTVASLGGTVSNFSGEAIVKTGCTNRIQGFSAPTGPMAITNGRFRGVETSYPQHGVRVTVTGTFTARTKARGRIKVHFKRVSGCDAVRPFTARPTTG